MSTTSFSTWAHSHAASVLIAGALLAAGISTFAVTGASTSSSRDIAARNVPSATASYASKPSPLIPMTPDQAGRSSRNARRPRPTTSAAVSSTSSRPTAQ